MISIETMRCYDSNSHVARRQHQPATSTGLGAVGLFEDAVLEPAKCLGNSKTNGKMYTYGTTPALGAQSCDALLLFRLELLVYKKKNCTHVCKAGEGKGSGIRV